MASGSRSGAGAGRTKSPERPSRGVCAYVYRHTTHGCTGEFLRPTHLEFWRETMRQRMISRAIAIVLVVLVVIWSSVAARIQEASEYQVEAAFLFHFAKFVAWPAEAFPAENSPITIGILGEDPFGDALETPVRNKTIDKHPFRIVHLDMKSLAEAKRCQIL